MLKMTVNDVDANLTNGGGEKGYSARFLPGPGSSATLPEGHIRPYPAPPARILWKGLHFLPLPRVICDPTWPQCKESYGFSLFKGYHGFKIFQSLGFLRGAPTPLGRRPSPPCKGRLHATLGRKSAGGCSMVQQLRFTPACCCIMLVNMKIKIHVGSNLLTFLTRDLVWDSYLLVFFCTAHTTVKEDMSAIYVQLATKKTFVP